MIIRCLLLILALAYGVSSYAGLPLDPIFPPTANIPAPGTVVTVAGDASGQKYLIYYSQRHKISQEVIQQCGLPAQTYQISVNVAAAMGAGEDVTLEACKKLMPFSPNPPTDMCAQVRYYTYQVDLAFAIYLWFDNRAGAQWKPYLKQLIINDGTAKVAAAQRCGGPVITQELISNGLPIPAGNRVVCHLDSNANSFSKTCPVIQYNGISYWPYSFVDNRTELNVVGYDSYNRIVSELPMKGLRYIWQVTVDYANRTITFWGQSNKTATVPWSELFKSVPPAPTPDYPLDGNFPKQANIPAPGTLVKVTGDTSGQTYLVYMGQKLKISPQLIQQCGFKSQSYVIGTNVGAALVTGDEMTLEKCQKIMPITSNPPADACTKVKYYTNQMALAQTIYPWSVNPTWQQQLSDLIKTDTDLKASAEAACNIPEITQVASNTAPPVPAGSWIICNTDGTSGINSRTCPVIQYQNLSFWPYSYNDNRSAINLVAYDKSNRIVNQINVDGLRYIWKITVDPQRKSVTLWGQANHRAEVPWSQLVIK